MTEHSVPAGSGPAFLRKRTSLWALGAIIGSIVLIGLRFSTNSSWLLVAGVAITGFAAYVFFWTRVHPRIYLGKGMALAALLISGAVTYMIFGETAHTYMWRRVFQLSGKLAVYQDPVEKWRVSYPKDWTREEQGVSGTLSHIFRPSKVTPTVYFSVTSRPNVGTSDLNLIVEGFFLNLPKGSETQIHERTPVRLPSGHPGYEVVYSEPGRRVPVKNKMLFVLDKSHLYLLTVGAAPLWFDRHYEYLNNLLYTLELPPAQ